MSPLEFSREKGVQAGEVCGKDKEVRWPVLGTQNVSVPSGSSAGLWAAAWHGGIS